MFRPYSFPILLSFAAAGALAVHADIGLFLLANEEDGRYRDRSFCWSVRSDQAVEDAGGQETFLLFPDRNYGQHRLLSDTTMRFSLIDQITELQPGQSIQAVKNLSLAEEYLQDHFPGFPIMPGVLMIESMVQTSAWLMRASEEFRFSTVLLKEAKAVKFNSFVSPGKTLTLTASVVKKEGRYWTLKASGNVGDVNAVSARLIMEQFNVVDDYPKMAKADETQLKSMKELFAVLYPQAATASSVE